MAGLEAYVAGVPGGLGAFADDPMGAATAALEARRRHQVEGAGYDPDKGLYDRYSEMLGTALGPTIAERSRAAADAMRRGDMATYQKLATDLSMDFGGFLGSIKPIRAYHGSPHDFDRFSMDKIGSGEGAQAYGHGLYFAENEGVARSYRDALTAENSFKYKGATPRQLQMSPDSEDYAALSVLLELSRDNPSIAAARKAAERKLRRNLRAYRDQAAGGSTYAEGGVNRAKAEIQALRSFRDEDFALPDPGRMYEVNIHADPERFLDWDKPLSGQTQSVRDAAMEAIARGADDAARASGIRGADVAAGVANSANPIGTFPNAVKRPGMAEAFREAGIPGIRYLDAGSRMAGDGSRNYVVFDDKLIEILRKYGIMAPVAGLGALAASGQDDPNL